MSWWDPESLSKYASSAIKTAQKKLDKVLDIKEDITDDEIKNDNLKTNLGSTRLKIQNRSSNTFSETQVKAQINQPKVSQNDDQEKFWNSWLSNSTLYETEKSKMPISSNELKSDASKIETEVKPQKQSYSENVDIGIEDSQLSVANITDSVISAKGDWASQSIFLSEVDDPNNTNDDSTFALISNDTVDCKEEPVLSESTLLEDIEYTDGEPIIQTSSDSVNTVTDSEKPIEVIENFNLEQKDNTADHNINLDSIQDNEKNVSNLIAEAIYDESKDTAESSSNNENIEKQIEDSGHTSADEMDTCTSSDIEVISIPASNGDGLSNSPIRQIMAKGLRRSSPTHGFHRRTDSGSSYDGTNKQIVVCQHLSSEHDPLRSEKLLKKLTEVHYTLDAKENKLLELSKENLDLGETCTLLKIEIQRLSSMRKDMEMDMAKTNQEYANKFADMDEKLSNAINDSEYWKTKYEKLQTEIDNKNWDTTSIEKSLKEKEQMILDLLEEGEKLSKQQLQSSNIIKKLRAKEKDNESTMKNNNKKIDEQVSEIEHLKKSLESQELLIKKLNDGISQQNLAVKSQEVEINKLKNNLEESEEKCYGLQATLDKAYKEIAGMHKESVTKASEDQEAILSKELAVQEKLKANIEQIKADSKEEKSSLISQIEELQLSLSRSEREFRRKEDSYKQEIEDIQQRLQEAESRNQHLSTNVSQTTRPLLRQIENLQFSIGEQTNTYELIEKNLNERLTDTQNQLLIYQDRERTNAEKLSNLTSKLSLTETQLQDIRKEKSKLLSELQVLSAKFNVLEDSKKTLDSQFEAKHISINHEISEIKRLNKQLENELNMERLKFENEKKKSQNLQEQLQDKEMQLQLQIQPVDSVSINENYSRHSSGRSTPFIDHDFSMSSSLYSMPQNKISVYDNLRQFGFGTVFEGLQSALKQRDGEINHLQMQIKELEKNREAMAQELVRVSSNITNLEQKAQELVNLKNSFKDLDNRYRALLEMYGEKVEEAQELKLDLQDVKDMYRCQIEELINKN